MASFDKGHEKLGGRQKGTRNKGTDSIKTLLNTLLPEEELAHRGFRNSRSTYCANFSHASTYSKTMARMYTTSSSFTT
jgi:hypothetical protein